MRFINNQKKLISLQTAHRFIIVNTNFKLINEIQLFIILFFVVPLSIRMKMT